MMGAGEIISSGEALSKLGAVGLLCVVVIALGLVVVAQWREGKACCKFDLRYLSDSRICAMKSRPANSM